MVGKLFNDLVTALDILPESSTVDLCVNHPSPCVLAGKVRVIVKRPCVYKSLVLTVTGTSRVWMRQGAKTIKAKQVFLKASKEIVFDGAGGSSSGNGGGVGVLATGSSAIGGGGGGNSREQRRASSLSSSSSLSNSHPSNNTIPVSPISLTNDTFPSPSTTTATATGPTATAGMTRMTSRTAATTTTTTTTGTTAPMTTIDSARPVARDEPSHRRRMSNNVNDSSPMTHLDPPPQGCGGPSTVPFADNSQPADTLPSSAFALTHNHNRDNITNSTTFNNTNNNNIGPGTNGHVQNQLLQGVNDIDFYLEFPSHVDNTSSTDNNNTTNNSNDSSRSLPSGPMKSRSGDSTIVYTLSATLVMSRRDILVNNQITTSIPFRIQCWQDTIDWRNQSEDHSYHGRRRAKIEFRLQVPKQLDMRRLQDLQFGFEARWRTLQDRLKVREIHYSIIEEETLILAPRMAPQVNTTVISTAVTHDCSGDTAPTNSWTHLREAARLQIPQPLAVMETMTTPWPYTLTVAHKLRVVFRFDQSHSKERDLQLSFPILIHPTLNAAGGPVHTHTLFRHLMRFHPQRRRARRALFGMVGGDHVEGGGGADGDELSDYDEDMDYDGEEGGDDDASAGRRRSSGGGGRSNDNGNGNHNSRHLPVYADREGTLLLMVGHEVVQETTDLLPPEQVDALGISIMPTTTNGYPGMDRRTSLLYSPSEASSIPNSPTSPTTMDQYSWGSAYDNGTTCASPTSTRTFSMYSTSPDCPDGFSSSFAAPSPMAGMGSSGATLVSRRQSSFTPGTTMELSLPLPPPYAYPSVAEGEEDYTFPPPSPAPRPTSTTLTPTHLPTTSAVQDLEIGSLNRNSKGKDRSNDESITELSAVVPDVGFSSSASASTSISAAVAAPTVVVGSSTFLPSFGLPSPVYEIQDSPLSRVHLDKRKKQDRDDVSVEEE
ncbi:hypothetical protein BGX33_001379 [Mortierella sp. NVP41]|nr:hypothetical protein BGX33_001379 [Mortierella sp. NVP41]